LAFYFLLNNQYFFRLLYFQFLLIQKWVFSGIDVLKPLLLLLFQTVLEPFAENRQR